MFGTQGCSKSLSDSKVQGHPNWLVFIELVKKLPCVEQ
jgi:hypothetical protein